MSIVRRRLAVPIVAAGLLLGAFASPAAAQRLAVDFNVTCVYYTETAGSCVSQTVWDDGSSTFRWYAFWGNSYVEL